MEQPFGFDDNDVEVEKMVRRIDKHTAAQVAQYTGKASARLGKWPRF